MTASDFGASETRARIVVATVFLVLYAALHFVRLGHYALWDDEANTALFAESVWRTGDTGAVLDHNVIAYKDGYELSGLVNRRLPPIQYYVAAPFVGTIGGTWGARLPFAIAGVLVGVLVQVWLWRSGAPLSRWILVDLGFLTNVPLILYSRQSRYYALCILLSAIVVWLYLHFDGSRRRLVALGVCAALLLATHALTYVALGIAFCVDYLLFGWRRLVLRPLHLLALGAIQVVLGAPVLWIWNPLGRALNPPREAVPFDDFWIWWWSLRDMNGSELGAVAVLAAAPLVYLLTEKRDPWLLRLTIAILVFTGAVALFSPQSSAEPGHAEIRYLVAAIPAWIVLTARLLERLPVSSELLRFAIAGIVFGTNTLQFWAAPIFRWHDPLEWRSTIVAYVNELRSPPPQPYRLVAEWLHEHATPRDTVYVRPQYGVYPLMFHVPELVYAWQFPRSARAQYPELASHHFREFGAPRWLIGFQNRDDLERAREWLEKQGSRYELVHSITDVRGEDRTRPELFWRTFEPEPVGDPERDGVYIYRRTDP